VVVALVQTRTQVAVVHLDHLKVEQVLVHRKTQTLYIMAVAVVVLAKLVKA
jgi:hypothetical protein